MNFKGERYRKFPLLTPVVELLDGRDAQVFLSDIFTTYTYQFGRIRAQHGSTPFEETVVSIKTFG